MAISWTKDQPAVIYLRSLVDKYFPAVGLHYDAWKSTTPKIIKKRDGTKIEKYHSVRDHPSHGVGGYVNRKTDLGGDSLHSKGRAADIYVTVKNGYLKDFGDELFDRLVDNASSLALEEVIWDRQIWSLKEQYLHPYTGPNPHTNHLHVAFTRTGSQQKPQLLDTIVKEASDEAHKLAKIRHPKGADI